MSNTIKFGTDGWRAIIGEDFTTENVARVTQGLCYYLKSQQDDNTVILGHDCRIGGQEFVETAAKVFGSHGIRVKMANSFVSTPMISLATKIHKAQQGVIITASHNPPEYNGYKLKSPDGGPTAPVIVKLVEDAIPDKVDIPEITMEELKSKKLLEVLDLEQEYYDYMLQKFDLPLLQKSQKKLAYDAMYGAGQNIMRRMFPEALLVRCQYVPDFNGQAPEPLDKNLQPLKDAIIKNGNIEVGIATDGDADRIGMYDSKGNFIDAHHIILLLIHYLHHYRKMDGKVVIAFSVTDKVNKLCAYYGLPIEVTKIGFKYIAEIMVKEDVLLGGEESGGIAVKGHIPERDGIYDGMLLYDFIQETGKSLDSLIQEIYDIVGPFVYERRDLHLDVNKKEEVIQNCEQGKYDHFGDYQVQRVEDLDGYKYFMKTGEWLMIRPSGTEPVLRVYAEAATKEDVEKLLDQAEQTILS